MVSKRLFDILASFIGLIILSPVFLVIIILIRFQMPGPIFFCQKRAGRYGHPFKIFKFRTMIVNHDGDSISVKGQDRITPLGALLRKYKLDELPELWNVFKGDMSIVGPRPDMPKYAESLVGEERLIMELRPGITGPATLKYATEEELLASFTNPQKFNDEVLWPDKVHLNLKYYYNRSFCGDIYLILQTFFLRSKNSHT
jgi:lipopolysaccharide/colanic/teichoic acid biosynthesis glycosyltransferase